ncbi:anion permease [Rhodococcus ruber]|uniref:Putative low-affinity inorganic phosphate transporter n=1 Tax=Rhodococcus ruber TaxID=1830 RepID=A0A098BPM5_9NOCA|nr:MULTISPECIES: inorganic phosphate transporter [Rhodococcus]AUM19235.1 inorganic phosphate transporter [Rhodococcus ruber]MBD8057320.1 inorganic phosphate transporter [Rhodococcus ruber]MCF8784657.1 inorganic phosphate transporter [Rhodococcus ruber]MCZ1075660.1 inorganic phosphate transporter [Rhodococcus sp. A5(2022)]MDO1482263.1 inorganic phosphate transporter [Rhodococcus ruber]
MDVPVLLAIVTTLAFDLTNGFHDSANSIAALVATRAARPGHALVLSAAGNFAGPLLLGTAVADTVGGVVELPADVTVAAVGAALTAAIAWNLLTWRFGLPSSSSHALVGGLVGAALVAAGVAGVQWGGFSDGRPTGVVGILLGLAISPVLGALACALLGAVAWRLVRRARHRVLAPVRKAEWVTAATLAFSHGGNDAQKSMGVITLLLVASGQLAEFTVPLWVKLAAATSLTAGTAFGGWRIVRTVGRGVYRMTPLDGLVSQGGAAGVIFGAALVGAPVSTTHVVAAGVVGVGAQRRMRHVHWKVVEEMGSAWIVTLPATALLGAALFPIWQAI